MAIYKETQIDEEVAAVLIIRIGTHGIAPTKQNSHIKRILSTMERLSTFQGLEYIVIPDPSGTSVDIDLRELSILTESAV